MEVIVVGSTGLCGSAFARKAIESNSISSVIAFSRRKPNLAPSDKLKTIISPDTDEWPSQFPENSDIMFSGIATTRAAAGSLDNQRLIDHDLQVKLAQEARKKGCKTFILISSSMASSNSAFAYLRLKGDTEQAIRDLGFEKTIILRPGPLLGERETTHSGFGSSIMSTLLPSVHRSFTQSLFKYPVYADEVASCALKAACTLPKGTHIIESKDILSQTSQ